MGSSLPSHSPAQAAFFIHSFKRACSSHKWLISSGIVWAEEGQQAALSGRTYLPALPAHLPPSIHCNTAGGRRVRHFTTPVPSLCSMKALPEDFVPQWGAGDRLLPRPSCLTVLPLRWAAGSVQSCSVCAGGADIFATRRCPRLSVWKAKTLRLAWIFYALQISKGVMCIFCLLLLECLVGLLLLFRPAWLLPWCSGATTSRVTGGWNLLLRCLPACLSSLYSHLLPSLHLSPSVSFSPWPCAGLPASGQPGLPHAHYWAA